LINFVDSQNDFTECKDFAKVINNNPTSRPIILESWKRCINFGLDPASFKLEFLPDTELKKKMLNNEKLIKETKVLMDYISSTQNEVPFSVALSDSEGWIIDYRGTPIGFSEVETCNGSNWSEKYIGNNGVGTVLSTKQPVLIYGKEHYEVNFKSLASIGIPIIYNEEILGVVSLSMLIQNINISRRLILEMCINLIETMFAYINNVNMNAFYDESSLINKDIIATAAHDIKNPLTIINELSQLGYITSSEDKMGKFFAEVIKQVNYINEKIDEL
jgi:transcriptional regulator of acetoin/glycerol metabolism